MLVYYNNYLIISVIQCTRSNCLMLFGAVGQSYMETVPMTHTFKTLSSVLRVCLLFFYKCKHRKLQHISPDCILKAGRALVGELEGVRLELTDRKKQPGTTVSA